MDDSGTGQTRKTRLLGAGTVAAVVLATACAGGAHPDTNGVAPEAYYALFSGHWALDHRTSDTPGRVTARPGGGGGFMGGEEGRGRARGGRGGGEGPPEGRGGGRGAGGFGGRRGGGNFEAMRATMEMARTFPEELTLTVRASDVDVVWPAIGEVDLKPGGDAVAREASGQKVEIKARWDGPRLVLERRVKDGGRVVDAVEPVGDGNRILVVRTIEGLPRKPPELHLAYDREG